MYQSTEPNILPVLPVVPCVLCLFDSSLPCRSMRCFCLGERLAWTTSRSILRTSNFLRSCNFKLFLSAQAEVFLDGGRCSFSGGSTTVVAMLQRLRQATVLACLSLDPRTNSAGKPSKVPGQQKTRSTVLVKFFIYTKRNNFSEKG